MDQFDDRIQKFIKQFNNQNSNDFKMQNYYIKLGLTSQKIKPYPLKSLNFIKRVILFVFFSSCSQKEEDNKAAGMKTVKQSQNVKMKANINTMMLGVDFYHFIYNINNQIVVHLYLMPLRKIWTHEEDRVLKLLKEQRGEKKWSSIAKAMEKDFGIFGRTGKQCRERYHNHLDSSIISAEWTKRQQDILYEHHELVGNKWSIIAQHLPGRSDNCVKNHFYSKLRKAVRKLNKIIFQRFANQYHQIKISLLYKIIQTSEQKFKINSKVNQDIISDCNNIKNQLYKFDQGSLSKDNEKKEHKIKKIIQNIVQYESRLKKNNKTFKKHKVSIETNVSQVDLPQPQEEDSGPIKKEDQQIAYYRMIMKICEEIVVSKNQ